MSYIIVARNPRTRKLIVITSYENDEVVAEFDTETEAIAAADNTMICKAWPYHFVEVPE
jgi:hypothetical protein